MKASELRIGNWVEFIQPKKGMYTTVEPSTLSINIEKSFKPIPLTEEWLVRFGFEVTDTKREQYFMWVNRGKKLRILRGIKRVGYKFFAASEGFYFDCEYVHQLQNLYFALTSEELTLKE